jgi:flagellin
MICDTTQSRYSSTCGKTFGAAVVVGGFTTIRDVVSNSDGSQWVVVGNPSGTNGIAYSSNDGTSWTGVSSASVNISGVCYSGTTYVCVGDTGVIYSSTNGTSWTSRTAAGTPANITFYDVCWSPSLSLFIAVGVDTTGGSHTEIQTSTDGTTWTARTAATTAAAFGVSEVDFGSSTYIIAIGTSGEIQYSANGTDWVIHPQSGLFSGLLTSIVATNTGAIITNGATKVAAILSISQLSDFSAVPSANIDTNAALGYSAQCGVMAVGSNGSISKSYPYLTTGL